MRENLRITGGISPVIEESGRIAQVVIEGHAPFIELQSVFRRQLQSKIPVEVELFFAGEDSVRIRHEEFEKARDLYCGGENPNTIVDGLAYQAQRAEGGIIHFIDGQTALRQEA